MRTTAGTRPGPRGGQSPALLVVEARVSIEAALDTQPSLVDCALMPSHVRTFFSAELGTQRPLPE